VDGAAFAHTHDLLEVVARYPSEPLPRAAADLGGIRTLLVVPLRKDSELQGVITAYRQEMRPFSGKQIALRQNFSAQAVIAMENARLLGDLREALEEQTASAEVLRVINASPGNLLPVFDAIIGKAVQVCQAQFGGLLTFDGELFHLFDRTLSVEQPAPLRPDPGSALAALVDGGAFVHIADLLASDAYRAGVEARVRLVDSYGARSALWVALRKDSTLLGALTMYRREPWPFSDKQIALLQSFAAQAVIAMENARLLTETREALEQQTATAEVLQVINRSAFDLQLVLDTLVETAARLTDADQALIASRQGGVYRAISILAVSPAQEEFLRSYTYTPGSASVVGRVALSREVVQVPDLAADPEYAMQENVRLGGTRTVLGVPLLREGEPIGVLNVARQRVEPFTDKQIKLVRTFADQAVIAIENARLLGELRTARDTAEASLQQLKATQASLIQAEKMASLGQLTAGIAHEIKNPLNFVNNFAELSRDLLGELHDAVAGNRQTEIDELTATLKGNLTKIAEHGGRADGIVRSMLEHSRGSSGERRSVNLNTLVDEALNLAYHGARARDQSFNITLQRELGEGIAPITLVPQDITRVLLNLFSNGFYAARRRQSMEGAPGFDPALKVVTHELGDAVEIRVRDNGIGIPEEVRDKLFQPFFTTKPTGEGTGLGLSISYDIVTQQHGGSITVDSKVGEFSEFTIRLPRNP
jgi:signal transduction histidine kinase